jgi:hypothetical protein
MERRRKQRERIDSPVKNSVLLVQFTRHLKMTDTQKENLESRCGGRLTARDRRKPSIATWLCIKGLGHRARQLLCQRLPSTEHQRNVIAVEAVSAPCELLLKDEMVLYMSKLHRSLVRQFPQTLLRLSRCPG